MKDTISLVPTSAHSGEGIPDLLTLMIQMSQNFIPKRLTFVNYVQCTVLEVKVIEGLGTTIDVVLVNGILRVNDTIVLCGLNGPIVTTIRALLTPEPMKEIRVKTSYIKHQSIKGSMGIKIAADGAQKCCAGTSLMVVREDDYLPHIKAEVMADLAKVENLLQKTGRGVFVQASTLGSLEALLTFLRELDPPIPVSGFNIGPVHKKDVMQASIMLEHKREFATILAFDVKIDREARDHAKDMGVKIFEAEIIYHLFDAFTKYLEELDGARREASRDEVVFPCVLEIIPDCVFARKNPIVLGVRVKEGIVKAGTPLCFVKENVETVRVCVCVCVCVCASEFASYLCKGLRSIASVDVLALRTRGKIFIHAVRVWRPSRNLFLKRMSFESCSTFYCVYHSVPYRRTYSLSCTRAHPPHFSLLRRRIFSTTHVPCRKRKRSWSSARFSRYSARTGKSKSQRAGTKCASRLSKILSRITSRTEDTSTSRTRSTHE